VKEKCFEVSFSVLSGQSGQQNKAMEKKNEMKKVNS
jgi:hypothetical protein